MSTTQKDRKLLHITENFDLQIKFKSLVAGKVADLLDDNKFKFNITNTGFEGFYLCLVKDIGLHKADVIRQLLKNQGIQTY